MPLDYIDRMIEDRDELEEELQLASDRIRDLEIDLKIMRNEYTYIKGERDRYRSLYLAKDNK